MNAHIDMPPFETAAFCIQWQVRELAPFGSVEHMLA